MVLTAIILLIILGVALMLLEFFIVPGITIAGLGGFALLVAAVVVAYTNYDAGTGHSVLIGVAIFTITSLSFALREKTWTKASLSKNLEYKVNEKEYKELNIGDLGITISRLAPTGKIMMNDKYYEAHAENLLIDENSEIEITKIKNIKITVKLAAQTII